MGWVSRYRHGKGFGVHSPFAYRLITEVLREKLPYYDWDRVSGRHERLLYRLACRFRPAEISAPAHLASVIMMAEPSARVGTPDRAGMIVADCDFDHASASDALRRGAILYIYGHHHKELVESLLPTLSDLGHGMVFDNESDIAIIVPDRKLPFQVFTARF